MEFWLASGYTYFYLGVPQMPLWIMRSDVNGVGSCYSQIKPEMLDVAMGSSPFSKSRVFGISGMERKVPGAVTGL